MTCSEIVGFFFGFQKNDRATIDPRNLAKIGAEAPESYRAQMSDLTDPWHFPRPGLAHSNSLVIV
jgi:hypothetical protein